MFRQPWRQPRQRPWIGTLGGTNLSLSIDTPGAITFAGQSITATLNTALGNGAITYAGQSVTPALGLAVSSGAIGVAGQSVTAALNTALSNGAVTFAGQSTTLTLAGSINVGIDIPGAILVAGQSIVLTLTAPQAESSSGGWNFYVSFEQMLRKKRQRQQEQADAEGIQNELDRNIARLLHEQIKKDEERAELERIRGLVKRYKNAAPVEISSTRVLKAIETAQQKETFASYLKLQQEFERMLEDEEEQFLLLLASFD